MTERSKRTRLTYLALLNKQLPHHLRESIVDFKGDGEITIVFQKSEIVGFKVKQVAR